MRTRRLVLAAILALSLPLRPACAADDLKEGLDFRLVTPPLPTPGDRIEVTEYFWYGCPHCFDLEPTLADWVRQLPADVVFRRVPAVLAGDKWVPMARLHYTLEAMNVLDRLHGEAFNAIHIDRLRLDDGKTLLAWAVKKGLDGRRFADAWASTDVGARVARARELSIAAGLKGVPALVIHGRYQALTTGTYDDLLETADRLIDTVRAGRRAEAGDK